MTAIATEEASNLNPLMPLNVPFGSSPAICPLSGLDSDECVIDGTSFPHFFAIYVENSSYMISLFLRIYQSETLRVS